MIFGSPVTPLQFFGYSIALSGLMYYKLGMDQIKQFAGQGGRWWSEMGAQRPAMRKLMLGVAVVFTMLLLLGGLAPFAPEQAKSLRKALGEGRLGN